MTGHWGIIRLVIKGNYWYLRLILQPRPNVLYMFEKSIGNGKQC